MTIDTRLIQNLLQLRLLGTMNLITSGQASDDMSSAELSPGSDTDFGELLQSLLLQSALDSSKAGISPSPSRLLQPAGTDAPFTSSFPRAAAAVAAMPLQAGKSIDPAVGNPSSYDLLIRQASNEFGVEPSLVKAVVHQESSFNPHAVSSSGAKGLMQLMDSTSKGYGVSDPFDPQQNVRAGTQFLSGLMQKYDGSEEVALAAYNAGPGRVDLLGIRTEADLAAKLHLLPQETQQYVRRVLDLKHEYASNTKS